MDLLIKNMEMPKYCRGCPFEVSSIYGQKCRITRKFTRLNDNEDGMKRHIACPLVALPEHGELIDEDEFRLVIYREIRNHKEDEPITMILKGILWEMDNAPTVLEASN